MAVKSRLTWVKWHQKRTILFVFSFQHQYHYCCPNNGFFISLVDLRSLHRFSVSLLIRHLVNINKDIDIDTV